MGELNGMHDKYSEKIIEIDQNVKVIRTNLSESVEKLTRAVERLAVVVETIQGQYERAIDHAHKSIPMKFVVIICGIIVLSFVGGGVLKEILELDVLRHWLIKS